MPWALVAMALIGPVIFYLHWPRIWFDTFERVSWYMKFHLTHTHYFVLYFGENLWRPPFPRSYPWVMTLVTVPAGILLASALGLFAWVKQSVQAGRLGAWIEALRQRQLPQVSADPRGTGVLLLLNFAFPILLIAQPQTPIFGGTKHWMPAMPYLSMMAGFGVVWAARQALSVWGEQGARAWGVGVMASAALLLPAAGELYANHPYGTSYYNELIGSHRGAADRKMMRQYWGYAIRGAAPWINANAPERARIWPGNATSWAIQEYKREGILREDLRPSGIEGSDVAIFSHQRSFLHSEFDIWRAYGTRVPAYVYTLDGVPLVSVYVRPKKP